VRYPPLAVIAGQPYRQAVVSTHQYHIPTVTVGPVEVNLHVMIVRLGCHCPNGFIAI